MTGIFNAGFENLSIMEIAERVVSHVPAEIIVTESNDPRSYRLSSQKLLNTGFDPVSSVEEGILGSHRGLSFGKARYGRERCFQCQDYGSPDRREKRIES